MRSELRSCSRRPSVRASDVEQRSAPDPRGRRNVQAAAGVDELALAVERQARVVLEAVVDVLDLELLRASR